MVKPTPEQLLRRLERARAKCEAVANLRQGLRKDGTVHERGGRRLTPARRARLAVAARFARQELLAADAALTAAVGAVDEVQ